MYGTGADNDVGVTMSDGTVLRVNVIYPTDPKTGHEAAGPFPVLLTQTPYGKGSGASAGVGGGADPYLVERGYIEVVADVRGTGDSGGTWGIFDPVQTQDSVTLIDWCARLAHSAGVVGTYGASYLGINQILAAGAVGKDSPLKAIFPVVSADDLYRDTSFMGGVLDAEFDEAYLGLTGGLNATNPLTDELEYPDPAALTPVELDHQKALETYYAAQTANILTDGDEAYDGAYWQQREPRSVLADIVANNIPAYLVGGEYDIFQRGEPLNYAGLQDAYDGRPVTAAMSQAQPVTGRYQILIGPWTHLVASLIDYDNLELEWFDTWLKGEDTGMATTPTPMHIYDLGTGSYVETTRYPYTGTDPTRLYLGAGRSGTAPLSTNDGTLSPAAPAAGGSDTMVWLPAASPCKRSVDQWSMGAGVIVAQEAGLSGAPCLTDDSSSTAGPASLAYTTAPFATARTLAGPADLTIYSTSTTADTEWTAELEDVAPSGAAKPLTEGALLGSYRAVTPSLSWYTSTGQLLLAYHPYTQASAEPVSSGAITRYDIEIFPTYATIPAGDRLRVTLASSDAPHLLATPPQQTELVGGIYQVRRTPTAPSALEVMLSGPSPIPGEGPTVSTGLPAVAGPVPAGSPTGTTLPDTGADAALTVAGLLLLCAGLSTRLIQRQVHNR
jgi:putative CocE/NonD family hydrolase